MIRFLYNNRIYRLFNKYFTDYFNEGLNGYIERLIESNNIQGFILGAFDWGKSKEKDWCKIHNNFLKYYRNKIEPILNNVDEE